MKKSHNQGFTLIETGIVLIIAGLFMVGLIKAYEINLKEKKEREYIKKTDAITSALAFYIQDHGIAVDVNNNPVPPPIKESRFSRCSARYNWADIGGIKYGQEAFQA